MSIEQGGAAPLTSAERMGELDVLRGFALLGVLIANFMWWSFGNNTSLPSQTEGFREDTVNAVVTTFTYLFVSDKANTLFAVLFGMGFWVQMERLQARGVQFSRIYLRRLFVLLLFGLVNMFLIWPWDILNLYAIVGFVLFALRGISARAMLAWGLVLTFAGKPAMQHVNEWLNLSGPAEKAVFSDAAIAARQDVYINGNYFDWVETTARLTFYDWIASGLILAWILYVLGRFLLGAYIARRGWIQRASELLPEIRRICRIALPLGLGLEALGMIIGDTDMVEAPDWVPATMHAVSVPIIVVGYATGMILLYHSTRFGRVAALFAPVGRMALTNYLVQGVFIGLWLYGFHGGLALAGQLPPKAVLPLCLGFFALQILFSQWWLARYRFGPMEWLWRALTYGSRPAMRAQPA